jgi:hypothetical protein
MRVFRKLKSGRFNLGLVKISKKFVVITPECGFIEVRPKISSRREGREREGRKEVKRGW